MLTVGFDSATLMRKTSGLGFQPSTTNQETLRLVKSVHRMPTVSATTAMELIVPSRVEAWRIWGLSVQG